MTKKEIEKKLKALGSDYEIAKWIKRDFIHKHEKEEKKKVIKIRSYLPKHQIIVDVEAFLKLNDINRISRERQYSDARFLAMYIFKKTTDLTLEKIGIECGYRGHRTVMNGIRQMEALLKQKKYKNKYKEILEKYEIN